MPGKSFSGSFAPLNIEEEATKQELEAHINGLSVDISNRLIGSDGHEEAGRYIESSLRKYGYQTHSQSFDVSGISSRNIEAVIQGKQIPEKTIIVGAHYDTVAATPGADDNASGVAALLYLAKSLKNKPSSVTLKFLAFSNEETHFYASMGSYAYAQRSRERGENILGMFSLEMLGYYSDDEQTQHYPEPLHLFYPQVGNFIAFVGNEKSRTFLEKSISAFRETCDFPSEGCVAPEWMADASRSDHNSFWKFDFPAVMITDTSNFRNSNYHSATDKIDTLNLDKMSRLVRGLETMIHRLQD